MKGDYLVFKILVRTSSIDKIELHVVPNVDDLLR